MKKHLFLSRLFAFLLVFSLVFSPEVIGLVQPTIVARAAPAARPESQGPTVEYTTPAVAILASEYTQALDTGGSWYTSWHYFVLHNSLEEALRSDGTKFVVLTDADIEAGALLMAGGTPRYPILISLASEAVSDSEVTALRNYVSAGGFLFSGSSSFTRQANGAARGDFALASEMGLHLTGYPAATPSWYSNQYFSKQQEHRLVNGIPSGGLSWGMTAYIEGMGVGSFPVLNATVSDAAADRQRGQRPAAGCQEIRARAVHLPRRFPAPDRGRRIRF